ncbi:MAG: nickel insertion protein, partial [Sphaerospermopsis kisseleviana]
IGMKKSRPGLLLTVICHPENLAICEEILFRETTTLGIRRTTQQRRILQREIQQVETPYGKVAVKVAWKGEATAKVITNVQPEYEDCADLARKHNIPWREIQRLALHNWYSHN